MSWYKVEFGVFKEQKKASKAEYNDWWQEWREVKQGSYRLWYILVNILAAVGSHWTLSKGLIQFCLPLRMFTMAWQHSD